MAAGTTYPLGFEEELLPADEAPRWSDRRVELLLGALVTAVVGLLIAMLVFVLLAGLPSFQHNGLAWFGTGGRIDDQINEMSLTGGLGDPDQYAWTFHAWPLIWSTIIIITSAVAIAFVSALFVSVFIVEFAPNWMKNILQPVVRLLASVPSVVYGLIGVLVVVPFINDHLISEGTKNSVAYVIPLSGYSFAAAVLILTVMIAPLMVAIFSDGLRAVRHSWIEGSLAAGVNRWRTFWKIAVRTARPAMVAGTVIATARAIGEAVMLVMVSGSVGFAPNPFDGAIFLLEPSRPLAATIIKYSEDLTVPNMKATLFAIASVLLFSAAMLSLAGWLVRYSMRRYLPQ
jgi:ABC-type phosphate transport system permease subunit